MNTTFRQIRLAAKARALVAALGLALGLAAAPHARAATSTTSATDDINTEPRSGEYRVTVFPYHRITDDLTGFGYLGYVANPDKNYKTDYLGWGVSYMSSSTVQWWAGLVGTYTNNEASADKLESRPFVGLKNIIPNTIKWNIYNYARWEYRSIQDRDTGDWASYSRFRNRFGIEFPLAGGDEAWKPKTWYGLADAEVMYRFDKNQVDPCRLRAGIAYIVSSRVRVELIYHMQWTRPGGGPLKYTDNILRLNIKVALNKGMLQRVFDGGDPVD
jgi:hypothetical protein